MARKDTRQYSLENLKAMRERGDYVPTKPEAPTAEIGEEFWQNAHVVMPPGRASVHLRIDSDVLEWFKAQPLDWQREINNAARFVMDMSGQPVPPIEVYEADFDLDKIEHDFIPA